MERLDVVSFGLSETDKPRDTLLKFLTLIETHETGIANRDFPFVAFGWYCELHTHPGSAPARFSANCCCARSAS